MKTRAACLLIVVACIATAGHGQTNDVAKTGTVAAPFLEIPVGRSCHRHGGRFCQPGHRRDITVLESCGSGEPDNERSRGAAYGLDRRHEIRLSQRWFCRWARLGHSASVSLRSP